MGIHFPNPLGIAGGVDKNATQLKAWQKLGCGFLEVGTVTPQPQTANPGKIIDRNFSQKILWNKMGFPNDGSEIIKKRILDFLPDKKIPLFVNVGKNRDTKIEDSAKDYVKVIKTFKDLADAFVVNISSPNTMGLRSLQNKDFFNDFISEIRASIPNEKIIVKLSPDLSTDELDDILQVILQNKINGINLTNTTLSRPANSTWPIEGGLSGSVLTDRSLDLLKNTCLKLGSEKNSLLIISTGGILNPNIINERLIAGADLVQTYSGLVFYGPQIWLDSYNQLKK